MSFSTAFTSFIARVQSATGFSTKPTIPNPYDMISNPEIILRNGVGYMVDSSQLRNSEFQATYNRQVIGVVLSKLFVTTDSNPNVLLDLVKSLKDEIDTLQIHMLENTDLSGIQSIEYNSTDRITFLERYIYTTVYFDVVYTNIIPC